MSRQTPSGATPPTDDELRKHLTDIALRFPTVEQGFTQLAFVLAALMQDGKKAA